MKTLIIEEFKGFSALPLSFQTVRLFALWAYNSYTLKSFSNMLSAKPACTLVDQSVSNF